MPIDRELLDRVELEPATDRELECKDSISPADLSLWLTKLELMCEEAKNVLVRTGLSPGIQALDCSVGLYAATGDLCLGSVGTYMHVCSGFMPIKYMLKYFKDDKTVGIKDGDIFYVNEVLYGGFHNPDQLNFVPIFWEGELIAWAGSAAHEPETGAAEPGGFVPSAKSRYDEGLKVPPIKIGENFELKLDLMDFVANMVRDERMVLNDIRARTAACLRLRQRVLELVQERGVGSVLGAMRRILEEASNAARERVRALNDGVYRGVRFIDDWGTQEGLGCVHVALEKRGDELNFDLSGTSPATASYLNAKPHILRGLLAGQTMMFLFADLPVSSGLLAPFKFKIPEGSVLNAPDESATSGSMRIAAPVTNSIMVALAKMVFASETFRNRACAPMVWPAGLVIGGGRDQYGQVFTLATAGLLNASGGPASPMKSGMDACQFWYSGLGDCLDIEHEEVQYPLLYLFRRIMMDGGGAGKLRGGSGCSVGYIFHNAPSPLREIYFTRPTRLPHDPALMGGYGTPPIPYLTIQETDWQELFQLAKEEIPCSYHEMLSSKRVRCDPGYAIHKAVVSGEGVATASAGSPGYGDPIEMDPEELVDSVGKGIVSGWAARNIYNVAYDEETLEIDFDETQKLRERAKAERKGRGQPYDEFEKGWLEKKPKDSILQLYGPWPMGLE